MTNSNETITTVLTAIRTAMLAVGNPANWNAAVRAVVAENQEKVNGQASTYSLDDAWAGAMALLSADICDACEAAGIRAVEGADDPWVIALHGGTQVALYAPVSDWRGDRVTSRPRTFEDMLDTWELALTDDGKPAPQPVNENEFIDDEMWLRAYRRTLEHAKTATGAPDFGIFTLADLRGYLNYVESRYEAGKKQASMTAEGLAEALAAIPDADQFDAVKMLEIATQHPTLRYPRRDAAPAADRIRKALEINKARREAAAAPRTIGDYFAPSGDLKAIDLDGELAALIDDEAGK